MYFLQVGLVTAEDEDKKPFCGGSIITKNHILTAAHCVVDMKIGRLWVSIGDHDTRVLDTNEKIIQADKIIIHVRYNPKNFQNDIGK